MYRVLIGAAHTVDSPGEVFQDLREADITRKILQKTIPYLEQKKIEFKSVPLDLPLMDRITWINNTGFSEKDGDIFVEIHVNDGGKRGIEGWFKGESTEENKSQRLGDFILSTLCKKLNYENQGIHSEYDHDLGSLMILNQTKLIPLALEILYIDNLEDGKILRDDNKLDQIGQNLAESIFEYIDDVKKNPAKKNIVIPAEKPRAPKGNLGMWDDLGDLDDFGDFPVAGPTLGTTGNDVNQTNPSTPKSNFANIPASSVQNQTNTASTNTLSSSANSNIMMDKEQRKEMINKIFNKVLGRDPTQTELNSNLNIGIMENELIIKLVNMQDHENMLNDAKKSKELQSQIEQIQLENKKNANEVKELSEMIKMLEKTHRLKDESLRKIQRDFVEAKIIKKGQYYDPQKNKIITEKINKQIVGSTVSKRSFFQKIVDRLK